MNTKPPSPKFELTGEQMGTILSHATREEAMALWAEVADQIPAKSRPKKEHRKPCDFCGRERYLLKDRGKEVCGFCIEQPDYLALQRHNETVERRLAKQKDKPKRKEDE